MTVTSIHANACFEAWMNCENLLKTLHQVKNTFSKKITKVVDECALICMGTFHAIKTSSVNTQKFALLCMGICEECAEICDELNDEQFQKCAQVCRVCSANMSMLAFTSLQ
ncbi:MAG: hypothetical protein ACXWV9_00230 [Flavisolibacter sp.]